MSIRCPTCAPFLGLALALVLGAATPAVAENFGKFKKEIAALPPQYQQWLVEVEFLISDAEIEAFLEIEQDYQRDAFIERFWRVRDPYPDSTRNEFKDEWYRRLNLVGEAFGGIEGDRSRLFLMNGPPDGRIEFNCTMVTHPLDIWFYDGSERVRDEFYLVFVRRYGGRTYSLWRPIEGVDDLLEPGVQWGSAETFRKLDVCKDGRVVINTLRFMLRNGGQDFEYLLARLEKPTEAPSEEWLSTFTAYSTDIPDDAATLNAKLDIYFTERYQSRTVTQVTIAIPLEEAALSDLGDAQAYHFFLTGELLQDGRLFENFRYRFDFPAEDVTGEIIPILFQRRLRPGTYQLVIKVEDLNARSFFHAEEALEVPRLEATLSDINLDPETERILEEANVAITSERATVQIAEPTGDMLTGMVRFDTMTTGDGIVEMRFLLDGRTVLKKRRPPFSVELDLGSVPRTHLLRAVAIDVAGNEIAADELSINTGKHRFAVRLVEPVKGGSYTTEVRAAVEVDVPEGSVTERVEFFLNETLTATLYQPPFVQQISLPDSSEIAYVRAVAYLPDGNSTEDLVFINAPDYLEEVEVEFVELYVTVLDKQGHPVAKLEQDDFRVSEDNLPQEIVRFERVSNLPIHVQVMLDVSASMEDNLGQTQSAALSFFEDAITPKDRASVITFNDYPNLAVNFTNDLTALAGGLAGLKAERGTALYDSLIFGLYYLNGIKGQRAVLLLSDGKDENSRFSFENALEYAQRAGVSIYAIGLDISGKNSSESRRKLAKLADETGGRPFFIKTVEELPSIYEAIQEELRSRYLIAYQSSNTEAGERFRSIELEVTQPGLEAKTMRGYYP